MKLTKYLPEAFCLLLYATFAVLFINALDKREQIQARLTTISALESIIPQQTAEILNTNFNSNLHYDLYAQFQLEIERLMLHLPIDSEIKTALEQYNRLTDNYMQLVTMLKTSRRLVVFSKAIPSAQQQIINSELMKFTISPTQQQKQSFTNKLSTVLGDKTKVSSEHLSIIQHANFIANNTQTSQELMEQVKTSNINSYLVKRYSSLQQQYQHLSELVVAYLFLIILSLLFIFIILLKRQQNHLKHQTLRANAAAKAKSLFLANMSHEIRTPLTGIIGLSELCLETKLSTTQKDYLDKVLFSATSLLSIINDILDYSKIEAGKLSIDYIDFEHEKLFENLDTMLSKAAETKGLEIIYQLDPNISPWINSDPVRLGQILVNLVGNGIKFTDKGHIYIQAKVVDIAEHTEIAAKLTDVTEYQLIQYKVTDTGIGLSSEQASKLFERFVQADDSTTRKYGGTGLGLSICRTLAELMHGSIEVQSQLNVGSTFLVTLPVKITQQGEAKQLDISELSGKTLLLLEDNLITQEVISKIAHHLGMQIEITDSVSKAISACQVQIFDYAIVDWHLPSESGLDFIKQMKSDENQPKEIVICSAFNHKQIEDREQLLKHHKFLSKPFTISRFYNSLTNPQKIHQQKNIAQAQQTIVQEDRSECDSKPRILLVEDNRINQTIATTILKNLNLSVDHAEDGLASIMKAKMNHYDVILMDIRMPVMDGMEATKELRKLYDENELVIIALTANVTEEEVKHYLSIGMNSHLCKPYDKQLIKEELAKYIDLK
ncbi:response regulator [Thalassotalea sp. PLHSN55]|uniref:response regulator n=1 Tax=Thalassotalea sp. PLHSN55 TaxID=3435888 RepID=UPI003F86BDF9